VDHVQTGRFPWPLEKVSTEQFTSSDELLSADELVETSFYREYMEPQGMSRNGVLAVVFGSFEGQPMAAVAVYPFESGRPLGSDDLKLLDLIVPHLAQAYTIHRELQGYRNQWTAASEVLDRIPMGVILIDGECRVSALNQVAERIVSENDGLTLEDRRPRARGVTEGLDTRLQQFLERAVNPGSDAAAGEQGIIVERPSGRRPFTLLVTSLPPTPLVGFTHDARAVIFVSDPEDPNRGMRDLLSSLYKLSLAEADLASLVTAGHSVEEAAMIRGVSVHTARSQLKNVFSKTNVHRQSDLVRLILGSVMSLRSEKD